MLLISPHGGLWFYWFYISNTLRAICVSFSGTDKLLAKPAKLGQMHKCGHTNLLVLPNVHLQTDEHSLKPFPVDILPQKHDRLPFTVDVTLMQMSSQATLLLLH